MITVNFEWQNVGHLMTKVFDFEGRLYRIPQNEFRAEVLHKRTITLSKEGFQTLRKAQLWAELEIEGLLEEALERIEHSTPYKWRSVDDRWMAGYGDAQATIFCNYFDDCIHLLRLDGEDVDRSYQVTGLINAQQVAEQFLDEYKRLSANRKLARQDEPAGTQYAIRGQYDNGYYLRTFTSEGPEDML